MLGMDTLRTAQEMSSVHCALQAWPAAAAAAAAAAADFGHGCPVLSAILCVSALSSKGFASCT
jgi:hypothetical protein